MTDKQETPKENGLIIPAPIKPPAVETITPLQNVAGKQPPAWNLKDHNELDGRRVVVVKASYSQGDYGGFVILHSYFWPDDKKAPGEDDAITLITGSQNVIERMAFATSQSAFPVVGRLRKSGRAWFLD